MGSAYELCRVAISTAEKCAYKGMVVDGSLTNFFILWFGDQVSVQTGFEILILLPLSPKN